MLSMMALSFVCVYYAVVVDFVGLVLIMRILARAIFLRRWAPCTRVT